MVPLAIAVAVLVGCPSPTDAFSPEELPELPAPVAAAPVVRGASVEPRRLRIALSGELRGELEPCGCPTLPYGGFVRRERLLGELSVAGQPLLQLDAGETLLQGLAARRDEAPELRSDLLGDLMSSIGVHAMTPGPTDLLALGVDGLRRFDARTTFPLLSATWSLPDGQALFPPSAVVEVDGLRVAVVGLSAPPAAAETRDLVITQDAVEAAQAAVDELPPSDLVVALSNLSEADADRVAEEVSGLALVLTTRSGRHDPPRRGSGSLVVEVPSRGRYLTLLSVQSGAPSGWPAEESDHELLARSWQLAEQLDVLGSKPDARPEVVAALTSEQLEVEAALSAAADGRTLVWVEDRPLGARLDGDSVSGPLIEAYKGESLERAAEVVEAATSHDGPRYASSAACTSCHSQQMARWTFTAHARAYRSLQRRDADENPECLTCHTTGFGEAGGFAKLDRFNLSRFQGVQCEACHGMLAGHPGSTDVMPEPVTPATCERCHDEANSPNFDFVSYLPRAHCTPVEKPLVE